MNAKACLLLAAALLVASPASPASSAGLGSEICAVLTAVYPEVERFDPMAARQRLVAAINMKFHEDAAKLAEVRASIDREAMINCRKEREGLMKIMQTLSLSDAFEGRF
jgi:hypothetical protein